MNEWPMANRMRHAAAWLSANFDQRITVGQAADLVAMSERSLLRHFTREFGVSPRDYLMAARLARACSMLTSTGLPADSIARRCGLGSGERLSRLFRGHLGMTPSEYRAKAARVTITSAGAGQSASL